LSARGITETATKVRARIERTWATTVAAEQRRAVDPAIYLGPGADPATDPTIDDDEGLREAGPTWPHRFALGRDASAELSATLSAYVRQLGEWRDWAKAHAVELVYAARKIDGTPQDVVSHVVVPDLDTATRVAGDPWPERVATGRSRASVLDKQFPDQPTLPRAISAAARLKDIDFDVLVGVCDYFLRRAAQAIDTGVAPVPMTPRQVPIEGVQGKWLESHQGLVRTVTGLGDLHLLPRHPARFHFTYLDRAHREAGGRRHDSYSVGDPAPLPYEPQVVLISENKDTAICFPDVAGGIAIEGEGRGATTIASAPWVRSAPLVVYWGDLDQYGLEILNEFRAAGLTVHSMLMDIETYQRYQRFGTDLDKNGKPVKIHPARKVPDLHAHERALYELLSSGSAPVPRVEQERIPLEVPAARLAALIAQVSVSACTQEVDPDSDGS